MNRASSWAVRYAVENWLPSSPTKKGVVASGYFASVIDQADGTPNFTVGSGVVLIGSVEVAEQPRP
jgi:hypothetical protein